ncbi:MAG: peroxiredoxin [Planctomycetota bacterium]|nr:peroxiredoxin [Planctomycetota bacterium]
MALSIGDKAPDFSLRDQKDNEVRLSAYRGKPVVVFFYPADGTPICTAQNVCFRDRYSDIEAMGAVLLGISADEPGTHERFASEHSLRFPLISDTDNKVAREWGARRLFGLMPDRVTFVIDGEGVVRGKYRQVWRSRSHVEYAIEQLLKLTGEELRD